MRTQAIMAVLVSLMLMGGGIVQAQESGKASGALGVGSSKVTLAHAYAFPEHADSGKQHFRLLITDQALPASAVKDEFERRRLLVERKAHGLEIVIDSANTVVSANLYHPDLPGPGLAISGVNQVKLDAVEALRVTGTVSSEKPVDHFGKLVEYRATFSAPVIRRPAVTSAELNSEPGKAAVAFLKAAAAADARALRAILTPDAVKDLEGPDGKEILKMLPTMVPRTMRITAIDVSGDTAIVTAEEGKLKVRFRVVRHNEQWRVTLPE